MTKVIGRLALAPLLLAGAIWLALAPDGRCDDGRLLRPKGLVHDTATSPNVVRHRCLTPEGNDERLVPNETSERWRLPSQALAADFDTTIHCLVLRYNFQYETNDNPSTTGRGRMDLSRPLDTLTDEEYIAREGYLIDPPPHDSLYFDAHMKALNQYWETVSGGKIHLSWDVYPPYRDSIYQLPHAMSYYGSCEFSGVVAGLEDFFVDCIRLADTVNPEIDFSEYQAFFLFHAGSDAQNDIGFPTTCLDLFSGYIKFGDTVWVDDSTHTVRSGLMMPETTVQDGRVTALNAVLAHEFGHQLGLIDIYSTANFFTQLGDYSLMDNNGFGTGIDFGFPAGKVFGAIPVFPDAWSRAFMGVEEVVDFRADTNDVEIVAAGMTYDSGVKIARLPISENEYYLIENRLDEVDGNTTHVLADLQTSVILGPVDSTKAPTGEYDFLIPGSGALILHVDEEVAALDYDGDGLNNFQDNDAQWSVDDRKFVRLVEADGIVNFGGYYYAGFGSPGDLFRDDRNDAFTPNSNPETIDNSGNETHFYIENIARIDTTGGRDNRYITFDFSVDRRVKGFPIRAGSPRTPLAPIADDLDGDGTDEVIMAAGPYLSVITSRGKNFIDSLNACPACVVYDSVSSSVNPGSGINPRDAQPVPVYCDPLPIVTAGSDQLQLLYTAGPVTGRVNSTEDTRLVAVGYSDRTLIGIVGRVSLYSPEDVNEDARADKLDSLSTEGMPSVISFGDSILWVLTETGRVHRWAVAANNRTASSAIAGRDFYSGVCRLGDDLIVLACDTLDGGASDSTWFYHITKIGDNTFLTVTPYTVEGLFLWGPVAVDMNRDGNFEIAAFSADGEGILVTVDQSTATPSFSVLSRRQIDRLILTPPSAGDIDLDGRPEILVGGQNEIMAFNEELIYKTGYPLEMDDRFPDAAVVAAPMIADIASDRNPEVVAASSRGNVYSFEPSLSYGFPLSSGEQVQFESATPAVLFGDSDGGKVGWLGGDGWFYAWEVDADTVTNFWPMGGCTPGGSFALDDSRVPDPAAPTTSFDDAKFYNYPNPVRGDETTIRYFLGDEASSVTLNIYDLSGRRVTQIDGRTQGGIDNEVVWNCSDVATGVYRCVIKVEFSTGSETAFKDIAVIR